MKANLFYDVALKDYLYLEAFYKTGHLKNQPDNTPNPQTNKKNTKPKAQTNKNNKTKLKKPQNHQQQKVSKA